MKEIKEENEDYSCFVCGDHAGKHSYYGGQVCASCRAFFRRSVQSKYYELFGCKKVENCEVNLKTRKNCQFCRFKKCLNCGMKVSWVLSDEERNRRFNKFNKAGPMKSVNVVDKYNRIQTRIPDPYMDFTIEESSMIEEIHSKFKVSKENWLFNLMTLNKGAFANFIESAYDLGPLKYKNWRVLEDAFEIFFVKTTVPQFKEVEQLPFYDKSQMLSGNNPRIAHSFKSALCWRPDPELDRVPSTYCNEGVWDNEEDEKKPELSDEDRDNMCPMKRQLKNLAENKPLMEDLGLEEKLGKLNINQARVRLPEYKDVYYNNWAGDPKIEARHRMINKKIQAWPRNEKNEMDPNMVLLMTVILLFNPETTNIVEREKVESLQLKYILLLQRYLKSKMQPRFANTKFLEGMLLISFSKEMWDLSRMHDQHTGPQA